MTKHGVVPTLINFTFPPETCSNFQFDLNSIRWQQFPLFLISCLSRRIFFNFYNIFVAMTYVTVMSLDKLISTAKTHLSFEAFEWRQISQSFIIINYCEWQTYYEHYIGTMFRLTYLYSYCTGAGNSVNLLSPMNFKLRY